MMYGSGMHGSGRDVILGLDREIITAKQVYMHPLVNDRTIAMSGADLLVFLQAFSITPIMLDI
jgi:Ala-tRNA(Pro) deacylase